MSPPDAALIELTAGQAVAAIEARRCSSVELATALLERVEQTRAWNAFITVDAEAVLASARSADTAVARGEPTGPLHGVPIAVKDNIHVAGLPNTAGSPLLRGFVPRGHAAVVDAVARAGAIVLGKTNMHELAFGITSNNAAFGAVRCAYAMDRLAGGSSGGSAVAVALRAAPAALGTDTGGSLRIPAAHNGIVSLRPTTGRYPSQGVTPLSATRDTVGPMARSVADLMLLDSVMAGPDQAHSVVPAELRIGFDPLALDDVDPAIAAAVQDALQALREAGITVVEAELAGLGAANELVSSPVVLYEARRDLTEYLVAHGAGVTLDELVAAIASPDVRAAFEVAIVGAGIVEDEAYVDAITRHRPALQALYAQHFRRYRLDAIVSPTTPLTAPPVTGTDRLVALNGRDVPTFDTYIRFTDPSSNAGVPSVCLPIGVDGAAGVGLPIGIELTGPAGDDRRLLAIADRCAPLLPPVPAPAV